MWHRLYLKDKSIAGKKQENKQVIDNLITARKFPTTVLFVPCLGYSNSKMVTATCNTDKLKMLCMLGPGQIVEPSWPGPVTAMKDAACNSRPC